MSIVDGRCPTAEGSKPHFMVSVRVPRQQLLNEIEQHTEGSYVEIHIATNSNAVHIRSAA